MKQLVSNAHARRAALWSIPIWSVALATCLLVPSWSFARLSGGFIDLEVYRIGVDALRRGDDLYGTLPPTAFGISLPFIYPPFAALALAPLAVAPWEVATWLFFAVSMGALTVTVFLSARRIWPDQPRLTQWITATAAPLMLLLEPVSATLDFGQINLVLMGLVAADCLAVSPKWRRGMLVGIAAAIKLTPAAFVLYFLVRKDYRAAATAAVTGVIATAIGFAVLPRESATYWFGGFGDVSGLSGSAFHTNQSVQAVLARLSVPEPVFTLAWLTIAAALTLVAIRAMRASIASPAMALSCNAVLALLVSPISWSHHWVWFSVALLAMAGVAAQGTVGRTGWLVAAVATTVLFAVGPHNLVPGGDDREIEWTPWQLAIGNAYAWLGVGLLLAVVVLKPAPPQQSVGHRQNIAIHTLP